MVDRPETPSASPIIYHEPTGGRTNGGWTLTSKIFWIGLLVVVAIGVVVAVIVVIVLFWKVPVSSSSLIGGEGALKTPSKKKDKDKGKGKDRKKKRSLTAGKPSSPPRKRKQSSSSPVERRIEGGGGLRQALQEIRRESQISREHLYEGEPSPLEEELGLAQGLTQGLTQRNHSQGSVESVTSVGSVKSTGSSGSEVKEDQMEGGKEVFIYLPTGFGYNMTNRQQAEQSVRDFSKKLAAQDPTRSVSLSTTTQVRDALESGASWCAFGWTKDGHCLYPMARQIWAQMCEKDNPEPPVGLVFNPASQPKGGAVCYGIKPSHSELEAAGVDVDCVWDFNPDRWSAYDNEESETEGEGGDEEEPDEVCEQNVVVEDEQSDEDEEYYESE